MRIVWSQASAVPQLLTVILRGVRGRGGGHIWSVRPWPSLPESDDSSLVSEAPATPPEPSPTSVATPPVETQPERPLILEHELDALAEDEVLFREPELVVENDPPQELDKSELAKLYLEMGDTAAANELMRTSKTG